ncbi:type IV pilus modification protein PilV [Marinicellulosiphila megalodicopiae]|uniref:type IV pilus modification protein PilV n=1 Tax=Marinicellulosiphila megalodicopiae TaxID=2724896 RepID=UPI003BAF5C48
MLSITNQKGFSLIESLVALLLVSVALLSMAKLINFSALHEQESLLHTTATILAYDMVERIKLNSNQDYTGVVSSMNNDILNRECELKICSPRKLKQYDMDQWLHLLKASLPNGSGEIYIEENNLIVLVTWYSMVEFESEQLNSIKVNVTI